MQSGGRDGKRELHRGEEAFGFRQTSEWRAHGRALTESIPALNLERGDRLEASARLPNTARFNDMRPDVGERVRISFWRRSRETRVRHRNPLLGEPLCLSPHRCLGVDWQHAKSLGTCQYYVNGFAHARIESSNFGGAATTAADSGPPLTVNSRFPLTERCLGLMFSV